MSEIMSERRKCEIKFPLGAIRKGICVTHNQSLLYAYKTKKGIAFRCQIGEDELNAELSKMSNTEIVCKILNDLS